MEIFDDALIAAKGFELLYMIQVLYERMEAVELKIAKAVQEQSAVDPLRKSLKAISGCGEMLPTAIALEIADINRFKSARDFVSYCRRTPSNCFSNGKSKGEGNKKNGNAYLSWTLTELATLATRFCEPIRKKYDRLFPKTKLRVKAVRALARAIWQMLKKQEAFDLELCFHGYVK